MWTAKTLIRGVRTPLVNMHTSQTKRVLQSHSDRMSLIASVDSLAMRRMSTSPSSPSSPSSSTSPQKPGLVATTPTTLAASSSGGKKDNSQDKNSQKEKSGSGGAFTWLLLSLLGSGTYAYLNQEKLEPYAKEYSPVAMVLEQLKKLPAPSTLPGISYFKSEKADVSNESKPKQKASTDSPFILSDAVPQMEEAIEKAKEKVKISLTQAKKAVEPAAPTKEESATPAPKVEAKQSDSVKKVVDAAESQTKDKAPSEAISSTDSQPLKASVPVAEEEVVASSTSNASSSSKTSDLAPLEVPAQPTSTSQADTAKSPEPTLTQDSISPVKDQEVKESVPETRTTAATEKLPQPGEPLTDVEAPLFMRDPTAVFEASLAKAALTGDVANEEARRRVQKLFKAVLQELVEYETDRLHDTERLRYLISKGSQRSPVMLAKIERKDKEFFDKLKYIIAQSQKESIELVDSNAQSTNAKFAKSYMDDLISEVEKVKDYIELKFTEQLQVAAKRNHEELAEHFNKELLAISTKHIATVQTLTMKYSDVFGQLVDKVATLQKVLDLHRNHRQYAEFAQRVALSVVEVERRLDQGVPLDSAWNVLSRLAQDDPTVSAAIENVPEVVVKRGAAPIVHLQRRFKKAEAEARTAAFIAPEGTFYSHALARVFGALTAREVAMVPVPKPEPFPEYKPFQVPSKKSWEVEKTIPPEPEQVQTYETELQQHQVLVRNMLDQFESQKAQLQNYASLMAKEVESADEASVESAKAAARSAAMAVDALLAPKFPKEPVAPTPLIVKETMVEPDNVYQERIVIEERQHKEQFAKLVRDQEFFNTLRRDHARLARAGYKLQEADLAGVLAELRNLESDRVTSVMGGFKSEVEDRVALEQSIKLLRAHASSLYVDVAEQ